MIFSDEAMMSFTIDNPRSCSAPEQMTKSPEASTSQVDTCPPLSGSITGNSRSSELPDTNAILLPDKSVSTSSPPDESEGLHQLPFPQPPPELATLLTGQSVG